MKPGPKHPENGFAHYCRGAQTAATQTNPGQLKLQGCLLVEELWGSLLIPTSFQ